MENEDKEYFLLEKKYSTICNTNELLDQVTALREEVPVLYDGLLKKEAKLWATKLQNAKIDVKNEFSNFNLNNIYQNLKHNSEEISKNINEINQKSIESKQIYQQLVQESEETRKIKEWLNTVKEIKLNS